ncbi:hypothetical protein CANINC_005042 [Pichia inconspicua]|uniref:Uncharacterized protein n=1 Tax=Pichia inconspicua TaxID=52247 RepID=A0A4T0WUG0_9ASCO|nr:hypothetical protein CANINC_005042 [[Candida] inconspicua]
MYLDDKITLANFSGAPVVVKSTPTTFFTASDKTIKSFNLQNPHSEPEVVSTLDTIKCLDITKNNGHSYALVAGNSECAWHDLTDFVFPENSNTVTVTPESGKLKTLWKNESYILQAVFTHGGQRACVGDMAANLIVIDVSNPNDADNFGKKLETVKVDGEITGLSYSYSLDLLAVTVADGGLFIYSVNSNVPEKKASLGNILVDKRLVLTHEMGLMDDDSDSDMSDTNFGDDDEDSLTTESSSGRGERKRNNNLLKFASARTTWNPIGDALAVPNKNYKICIYKANDWSTPDFTLDAGVKHHKNHVSALGYAPNGSLLATAALDKTLLLWDLEQRKVVAATPIPFVPNDLVWSDNSCLIVSSINGKVLTIDSDTMKRLLQQGGAIQEEEEDENMIGEKEDEDDLGDDVNVSDEEENANESDLDRPNSQDAGFVVGDEYADDDEDTNRRRTFDNMSESTELTDMHKRARKEMMRRNNNHVTFATKSGWGKVLTTPFSVGSTPWAGSDRRYLTITPVGSVYTVKIQDEYKITVLFFDETNHRKYFFDDVVGYDICSLNDQGAVFATSGYKKGKGYTAVVEYKDHEDGRTGETKWKREIALRPYEFITSVSVYGKYVFVCTNKGFVKKFNLYGRLMDVTMMDCVAAIMNNNNYVFTIVKRSIESGYLFNIQNLDGEYVQQEVGIPLVTENDLGEENVGIPIKSMFFSSDGEPCVVRNDNILLVLTKWRDPMSKPIWKPLLDIQEGVMRAGKGRELKAWPLGLFGDSFTFVPFRGSKNYPIFPLLTPTTVDLRIPINYEDPDVFERRNRRGASDDEDDLFNSDEERADANTEESENPEEKFLRTLVLAEMLNDSVSNNEHEDEDGETLQRLQVLSLEYDKTLLIQIDDACTSGDADDAYELCKMIRDFRALHAAQRLAEAKGMAGLARRIRNLREARVAEEEENVLDEMQD